jgi:hypothetical protein
MSVTRLMAATGAVAVLVLVPGCITLFSKTEVVRDGESPRPVRFESPEAAEAFHRAMKAKHDASRGGAYVGVPFVTLYSRDRVLSPTARFNDAVARCDTDQDGLITLVEAQIYEKSCD